MKTITLGILLFSFNLFSSKVETTPNVSLQSTFKNPIMVSDGAELFNKYCSECHAVSKEIYGPALKDIENRRNKEWIIKFVLDEEKFIKTDTIAKKMYEESDELHTTFSSDLSKEQVEQILTYIKKESTK